MFQVMLSNKLILYYFVNKELFRNYLSKCPSAAIYPCPGIKRIWLNASKSSLLQHFNFNSNPSKLFGNFKMFSLSFTFCFVRIRRVLPSFFLYFGSFGILVYFSLFFTYSLECYNRISQNITPNKKSLKILYVTETILLGAMSNNTEGQTNCYYSQFSATHSNSICAFQAACGKAQMLA